MGAKTDFLARFSMFGVIFKTQTFVKSSVADPDPGSGAFLTPGSGMGKKSGSGTDNPDHISESLEVIFWVKYLNSFTRGEFPV